MGEFLGPYELRGELGRGAMAIVWRGYDPKLEREVAIKEAVIPATADAQMAAELGDRFVREGKAAAALNHPGIVTIYTADIYEGRPCIVMELIEGSTLTDILAAGRMLPGTAVAILDQLLDAAGYAHSRGVVHRDLKPDNVFLTADGRVKLADFGIAHVGEGTALTHAGTIMGTPGYMAPEQVQGLPTDARADIFAIGVIGYELLTGRNPFGVGDFGTQPTTIMYRIVHEQPDAIPDAIFAAEPFDLRPVIDVALAKDAAARFPDVDSFRFALRGGALPTGSVAHVAAAVHRRSSGLNPVFIGIGAVAVLVLAVLYFNASKSDATVAGDATASTVASAAVASAPVAEAAPESRRVDVTAYGASVELPNEWSSLGVTSKNGLRTYKATSPSGATLRVDQNTQRANELDDPWQSARGVEEGLSGRPSYERISMNDAQVSGRTAVQWEFLLEDKNTGVLLHKADLFFQNAVPGYPTAAVVAWPEGDNAARDDAMDVLTSLTIP